MRITNLHANLIVAIMWISAGLFFYYLFYPFNPIEMKLNENGKLFVVEKQVMAGQDITVLMDFNKKQDCKPTIEWYLVDGFVLKLSETKIRRPLGEQKFQRKITIPETAPKETVHLRVEYECRINIFRSVYYSWDTENFEVVALE